MGLTRRSLGAPATGQTPAGGGASGVSGAAALAVEADPYAALTDGDPDIRRRAVLELAGRPGAIETLLAHVGEEPDLAARQATLTALAGYDTVEVTRGLMRYVRCDDAALRNGALEAIAAMPTAPGELVPALLADPAPDVRILTAMLLEELRRPETVGWLVGMLSADTHPNVVSAALDAFLPLAAAEHVDLLTAVRDRFPADPFIRFTVDAALPGLMGR